MSFNVIPPIFSLAKGGKSIRICTRPQKSSNSHFYAHIQKGKKKRGENRAYTEEKEEEEVEGGGRFDSEGFFPFSLLFFTDLHLGKKEGRWEQTKKTCFFFPFSSWEDASSLRMRFLPFSSSPIPELRKKRK